MSEPRQLTTARTLHAAGDHYAAEAEVLDALKSGLGSPEAWRVLASIENALGRFARERHALERALSADANDADAWLRLGSLRARNGDDEGAADAYAGALRAAPDNAEAHESLIRNCFARGRLEESQSLADRFVARFPNAPTADLLSGHIQKARGDFAAAEHCYRRALAHAPLLGEAVYNLVDLEVPPPDSPLAIHAAKVAADPSALPADRINACFASARILDRARRYSNAMARYRDANETAKAWLTRQGMTYVEAHAEARIEKTLATYPAASFREPLPSLPVEITPIFIIGLPRSGTTLIEQILAAHPQVEAAGELTLGRACERRFLAERAAAGRSGPVDPADSIDRNGLEDAREQYLDGLLARDFEGPWVIDKLPANFEIAGFLHLLFPEAPLIHSVRDPRATCFSLYCANFAAHEPYYHDLDHLAHYHHAYRRLMAHWHGALRKPIVEVGYEDLVRTPKTQIPSLLERLGLPPHEGCLDFDRHERAVLTASYAQVRQPMNTGAIDHWRNYSAWLGPLLPLDADRG